MRAEISNSLAFVLNPEEKYQLEILKSLIKGQKDFNFPLAEYNLLRFLRHRKNNGEEAAEAVKKFLKGLGKLRQYKSFMIPTAENMKLYSRSVVLKYRDGNGCQIILIKLNDWQPSKLQLIEYFMAHFAIVDTITEKQLTQLQGVVFIVDCDGFGVEHFLSATPRQIKQIVDITNVNPTRIKAVHFINNPEICNALWSLVKTFLKNKLIKRLHFHGHNYRRTLHEFIDPKILPKCFGGFLNDGNFGEKGLEELLLQKQDYYKEFFDE